MQIKVTYNGNDINWHEVKLGYVFSNMNPK
jgi:hypothetical protein